MEVLLVVLLMGLAASAVTLTMGGAGKQDELTRSARQFVAATEVVLDETVLSGAFIGIVIDDTSYRYVYFDEDKWKPLEQDRILAERQMEPGVSLDLILEGLPLTQEDEADESWFDELLIEKTDEEKKKFPEPQIMLFPSGEMTGFELNFIAEDDAGRPLVAQVLGDSLGRLSLARDQQVHD